MKSCSEELFNIQGNEDKFNELKATVEKLKAKLHKNFISLGKHEEAKRYESRDMN